MPAPVDTALSVEVKNQFLLLTQTVRIAPMQRYFPGGSTA
jgi:hypothetical protein